MRKWLILAALPLLGACSADTNSVWQPVLLPAGGKPPGGFQVIQNVNPPYECRVLKQGDPYPDLYQVVQGPMTEREGYIFIRDVCRAKPAQ